MTYKESDPFYHRKEWKKVREIALTRDGGLCQACLERLRNGYGGKPRRATMVHHIIPIKERPDLALCLDNLQSLCFACHEQMHPEKRQRGETAEKPGRRMRVVKV